MNKYTPLNWNPEFTVQELTDVFAFIHVRSQKVPHVLECITRVDDQMNPLVRLAKLALAVWNLHYNNLCLKKSRRRRLAHIDYVVYGLYYCFIGMWQERESILTARFPDDLKLLILEYHSNWFDQEYILRSLLFTIRDSLHIKSYVRDVRRGGQEHAGSRFFIIPNSGHNDMRLNRSVLCNRHFSDKLTLETYMFTVFCSQHPSGNYGFWRLEPARHEATFQMDSDGMVVEYEPNDYDYVRSLEDVSASKIPDVKDLKELTLFKMASVLPYPDDVSGGCPDMLCDLELYKVVRYLNYNPLMPQFVEGAHVGGELMWHNPHDTDNDSEFGFDDVEWVPDHVVEFPRLYNNDLVRPFLSR